MTRSSRFTLATTLVFAATALAAETGNNNRLRSDTDHPSNFKAADFDPATRNKRASNWPGLPERQGGKSYSKLIFTTSGFRERNAESGRR